MKVLGNTSKMLLNFFISFIISSLIVVIFFSIILPTDAETGGFNAKYDPLVVLVSIILTIITNFILEFNGIQNLKNQIEKADRDIEYVESTNKALIEKAEKVKDKFLKSEKDVFTEFAKARKTNSKIKNSTDFKAVLESNPEYKSNEATQKLLEQIEMTEGTLLQARTIYSDIVYKYNAKINSFPGILLKKMCGFKNVEIKSLKQAKEIISDEELGI